MNPGDPGYQYKSFELPSDVFNASPGSVVNYNGKQYTLGNPGNGTRTLTPYTAAQAASAGGYDVQSLLKAQADQEAANQKAISDFTTNFTNAVPGIVTAEENKFNYPQLAETATSLGNKIAQLGQNVGNTATGYSSADQVNGAISTQYEPTYQLATNTAQTAENLANTGIARDILPYQQQATLLGATLPGYITAAANNVQGAFGNLFPVAPQGGTLLNSETGQTLLGGVPTNTSSAQQSNPVSTPSTPSTPSAPTSTPGNVSINDNAANAWLNSLGTDNSGSTGYTFGGYNPNTLNLQQAINSGGLTF